MRRSHWLSWCDPGSSLRGDHATGPTKLLSLWHQSVRSFIFDTFFLGPVDQSLYGGGGIGELARPLILFSLYKCETG